ncbi:hypothetical protein CPB86DRAFT_57680 [Serendipita vermifera]|nr:hypothetical protein CPB86DRAFT_57680 [Serendipita vermifera]
MPAEQGTLELISTRKCPIRSLEVSDAVGMGCEPHRFEELNVTSLEVLSLDYVGNENIKGFMDLALRSAQQQITLKWMAHALNLSQFHHELIPRVVDLQLSVDGLDLEGISELAPIPLPNVQTCQFHNHHGLLKVFNLSNAEKLDIQYWVNAPDFTINSLPTHLTEMLLGHLTFTTAMLSTAGPHFMPYLKTLIIDTITCQGPLKRYFHVPKLKHFQIKRVFFSFDYNNPDEEEEIRVDSAQLLCDDSFFRSIPELEVLSLRGMTINGEFVAGLRACLLLERLTLVDCSIEEFIHSFLARVANIKTFPALKFLDLSYSWPKKSDTSYKHFVARCTVERPQLRVNASHRPEEYLSEEISSLESASDSDYDDYF